MVFMRCLLEGSFYLMKYSMYMYIYMYVVCCTQVISKSSEEVGDSATEEKYLIATSEQPLCAMHR
jgi:seryl-tRNA synthetase